MTLFSLKYCRPVLILPLLTIFFGCKKFVEIKPPATSLSSSQLFETEQGAVSAVSGLYSQISRFNLNMANGGVTVYAGLSADEIYNTSPNPFYDAFRDNALSASNEDVIGQRFWSAAYATIYQANAILEGLQSSKTIPQAAKNQLRGEMLFVRSFHYFYLANLFGDVPYIATTDYKVNAVYPRTPVATIYSSMVADLQEAQGLLPEAYPSGTRGRPNKWTATALLARLYLYQKDWANAETQATNVLASGLYSLNPILNDVFLPGSPEVIWQLQRNNTNTAEGNAFVPSSATTRPALAITSYLLNAFDSGDNRKTAWLQISVPDGQTYYYPYKYKVRTSTPVSEYLTVFRLAEIYLIRAEARANQNKLTEGQDDVNAIRGRAGLVDISTTSMVSLLSAIEHERQVELFAEWGHRWLDLKRTVKADAVLSLVKGSIWRSTDQLYPIPFSEIQKNSFLTQNPGY